jgi:hypothetical protein
MSPDIMEDEMDNETPSGGVEICVPSDALQAGDETGAELPEIGDEVSFEASGKVSRVENGMFYLSVTSANGEPIDKSEDIKEDSLEAFGKDLESQGGQYI